MSKELGLKISELLKKQNISRKDFAKDIGKDETIVSRYIKGEREPNIDTLANIATALNTTTDFLLGIENDESFNKNRTKIILARNSSKLSEKDKLDLINAIFGKE